MKRDCDVGLNANNECKIDRFCDELKSLWKCVPEYQFSRLMHDLLTAYVKKHGRSLRFPDDDELMEFFIEYIGEVTPYVRVDDQ